MGLCQPSKNYTVNLKTYSGGGSISKTIAECVNLIKGVNSSYDFIFLDPYNYPYIIGGYTLPANTTDLYFVTDAKYASYTNMIGVRGESNGTAISVLYTQLSMYCIYNDGTRLIGAGVGHNFSSTTLDGNTYRTASGSYEYPYIFYCARDDVNIYINDTLQLNWENANTALYKLGTKTYGLQDEWLSKLNEENPFSGITITHSNLFTYMVDTGDIIDIDWSKGIQTINMKYGKMVFGSDGYGRVHVYDNNDGIIVQITGILTWLTTRNLYFIACVNHEHQVGRIGLIVDPGSYGTSLYISPPSKNREAYEFITQNVLGATVKVNYYIPEGAYQYCKLTYKKDKEPESVNDGTIINIDPTETDCLVEGLDENQLYYFTIYTDKSESEPFPFTVTPDPVPPEYKTYIDKMNKPLNIDNVNSFNDGFWFANLENKYRESDGTSYYNIYPFTSVSWFVWENYDDMITPGSIITLNINGNDNDGYNCSVSFNLQEWVKMNSGDTIYYINEHRTLENYKQYHVFTGKSYSGSLNFSEQYSNLTLIGLFEILSQNYRNVNIKVNGVLWSKAGK